MKDPDVSREAATGHAIMHMFQYNYRDCWVPERAIFRQDRLWVKVFNDLVERGLIVRRKTATGYQYRWAGQFP